MRTFVTALAVLLFVPGLCLANPVYEYFLSEIQVAPDSEERIEIHMYTRVRPFPVDLSGWQVTTRTCTAYVSDGAVLEDSNSYIVLSRENLTGTFALADDSDCVRLYDPEGGGDEYEYGRYGWTPPAGLSATTYSYWYYSYPDWWCVVDWYLDPTPTFGRPNDDRDGGIGGRVLDRFGQPLRCCWVTFRSVHGSGHVYCDSTGRYVMQPLGPGTYEVSAGSDSTWLPAIYPESVTIAVNQFVDSVNMTMYQVGLEERAAPGASRHTPNATIARGTLWFTPSPFPLPEGEGATMREHAVLLDAAGRSVLDLHPGPNDVRALQPGIYFVRPAQAHAVRKVILTR